jgi:hypothetical protein
VEVLVRRFVLVKVASIYPLLDEQEGKEKDSECNCPRQYKLNILGVKNGVRKITGTHGQTAY